MKKLKKAGMDQLLWEIGLYAARNKKIHSGLFGSMGVAKFEELLKVMRDDLNSTLIPAHHFFLSFHLAYQIAIDLLKAFSFF